MDKSYITNPIHGGKITCHKCNGFIQEGEGKEFVNHPNDDYFPPTWFHTRCFNRYEHYYGLDKPLD